MKKGFIEISILIAIGAMILSSVVSLGWYSDHRELVDYRNELNNNLLGSVTSTALSDTINQFRINTNDNFNYLNGIVGSAVSSGTTITAENGLYGGGNLSTNRVMGITTTTRQSIDSKVTSSTQVIAGTNLTGGGALTGNVTLNVSTTPSFNNIILGSIGGIATSSYSRKNFVYGIVAATTSPNFQDIVGTFKATSTIKSVWVMNGTSSDFISFNFYYATTSAQQSTSTMLGRLFTADKLFMNTSTTEFSLTASSTPCQGCALILSGYNASSSNTSFTIYYDENQ